MENKQFQELLLKYGDGKCSPEEKIIVESWYNYWLPENNDLIHPKRIEEATDRIWHRIEQGITPVKKLKSNRLWKVAASLLIVFSIGMAIYLYNFRSNSSNLASTSAGISPGGNVAILTLADGSKIELASKKGKLAREGNIDIIQNKSGQLSYLAAGDKTFPAAQAVNMIETPKGGEYVIQLSDGTKVYLNSMSSLRFPAAFSGKERRVSFTGEVYLQVAHDASRPFIVEGGNQSVKVLGTEFNINAYKDQKGTQTSLVNGKIEVRNNASVRNIFPGQQAVIRSVNSDIIVESADLEAETAWHNGYFRFKNEDIHSVMDQLSRWYDVEIEYAPEISHERFSGVISRYKNINEVLDMLGYSKSVHFKLEGRRLTISK